MADRKNISDVDSTTERRFNADATDEELIATINSWIKEAEPYHETLLAKQKETLKYYEGDQTDKADIPGFNSDTVHNRIFEGTETLVPIISGQAHEFVAMPGNDNEISLTRSQHVKNVLGIVFEDFDVRERIEEAVRDVILKRFGVIEYYWDDDTDDIAIDVLDPRIVLIPKLRVRPEALPYVIKVLEFTKEELIEEFDLDSDEVLPQDKKIETGANTDIKTYQVFEVWTKKYVAWKLGDKILKRDTNPYWNEDGDNFLKSPQIPIIFIAPFRTGEAPVAPISLAEVAISIQDDINTQKRRINNNLALMGNGQIYADDDALSEEQELTSEPGLIIKGKGVASENKIRREPGTPLPAAHFQNLLESKASFDAIFGVQPAIRGQGDSGTLGGQILNRQQNLTRIELITREVNRGVDKLANGVVQLMKLFYTERKVFRMMGKNESIQFFEFINDDIENDLVIRVKSGISTASDPEQRANKAIQLWQLGALDPLTLYREVGFPNPEETVERLQAYQTGQLVQKTQADITAARLGQSQTRNTPEAQPRKVENNTNSIQRSQQQISGGQQGTPKGTPK